VAENSQAGTGPAIVVRVLKYDGAEHRTWPARVVKQVGPLIVLDAVFAEEIQHDLLGTISSGTTSKEYYWLDRWYNVFRFSDAERTRFYCNITQPPAFEDSVLSYVDLDIDVLVESDFSYQVLDLDDFEASRYPEAVKQSAREALDKLVTLVETRSFPFDEQTAT
jgi:protein associated with RNAse G/E